MGDGPTEGDRHRAYNVMMHALAETHRILKLDRHEVLRRQQDIYRDCFEYTSSGTNQETDVIA